jgi:hypothetical protein
MFDSFDDAEPIPADLDRMPPGPALGAFLSSIELGRISGHDRVVVLRALQRQASHLQAQVYAAMEAVAEHMEQDEFPDDPALAWAAATTEIRAALRLTRRAAETQLDLAVRVRRRLPRVWIALLRGAIDARRAGVITDGTSHLDEPTARQVVAAVIGDAPAMTTGQLAARLRRLCIETDPTASRRRYERALERRRVTVEASVDGTAHLCGLDLPPERVAGVISSIDRIARSLHRKNDPRNLDQLRADVYVDLLSGARRGTDGGTIELRVDLDTLVGLSEAPGELAGYGPVIADITRQITETQANTQWRYTVTDPATGLPLRTGTTRRRPTMAQRRSVEARQPVCIFPGCRMPAHRCDLDHRVPWSQHRRTTTSGLDPLCRYDHHTVRHRIGWHHQPLPGGDHLWTSPLGHHYTTSGHPP